jgi:hypothetical protein
MQAGTVFVARYASAAVAHQPLEQWAWRAAMWCVLAAVGLLALACLTRSAYRRHHRLRCISTNLRESRDRAEFDVQILRHQLDQQLLRPDAAGCPQPVECATAW